MSAAAFWKSLNRVARNRYRALVVRHPVAARRLKAVLYPMLLAGNRALLHKDYVPMQAAPAAPGLMARHQVRLVPDWQPLVSVVVPNFNHAEFLHQRLQSIIDQTYTRLEVIVMDDASTDGSVAILRDFAAAHGARLVLNTENSGGAFRQWQAAMAQAKGDLIWIAESDDWADPGFLARLVPYFANPAVMLAFGRTAFMDRAGTTPLCRMEDQLPGVDPALLAEPFILTAPEAVRAGFGHVNLIPNASGAVFRRTDRPEVLEPAIWADMRSSGDWVFYLNILRGGMLAYDPGALSYFRNHGGNSSVRAHQGDEYYAEHQVVAQTVARHYGIFDDEITKLHDRMRRVWLSNRTDPVSGLDALFDPAAIRATPTRRRVVMASVGFTPGGAENSAIVLANLLMSEGATVTFLDCGDEIELPEIRARLARDIPVVTATDDLPGLLHDLGADVIHSHHAWVDQTILDNRPADVAHVVSLRGMYETMPPAQRTRLLNRLLTEAQGLAAPARLNMQGLPEGAVRLIPNAVMPGHATPLPRAAVGVPEGAFLISIASRAIAEKGWSEAITAVTRARQQTGRDIHLALAGSGPLYDFLTEQGVPDYVHLLGFVGQVGALFAASDLVMLPSRFPGESYPLSVVEALGAGTPVLASDVGEVRQMLTAPDGAMAGQVFALQDWQIDQDDLTARLVQIVQSPDLLAGWRQAVGQAVDPDAPRQMARAYLALYDDAVAKLKRDPHADHRT